MFTGSVNLTHNGLESSDENLVRIEEAEEVIKHLKCYEGLWDQSEILRLSDLEQALQLRERKGGKGRTHEDGVRWS